MIVRFTFPNVVPVVLRVPLLLHGDVADLLLLLRCSPLFDVLLFVVVALFTLLFVVDCCCVIVGPRCFVLRCIVTLTIQLRIVCPFDLLRTLRLLRLGCVRLRTFHVYV
jgi:hypothetical protein